MTKVILSIALTILTSALWRASVLVGNTKDITNTAIALLVVVFGVVLMSRTIDRYLGLRK